MLSTENSVDVVILSWNRVELTKQTILSVLDQKEVIPNVWIIDQGSNQNQLNELTSFIMKFPQIKLIENKKNTGVAAGRNLGMSKGHAEFIFCLDNDATFKETNCIIKTISRFHTEPQVGIIGFKIDNYFTNQLDIGSWAYPRQLISRKNEEFYTARFCGAGHAIRRKALEKTKSYDKSLFFYWEELDLSYQVIQKGYKILYFPDTTILHKASPEARVIWKNNRFFFLVRNALYIDWKFYNSPIKIMILSIGYLIKGLYNNLLGQTLTGIWNALDMMKHSSDHNKFILNSIAKQYIYENDTKYRGTVFERIKKEIFEKLNKNNG